MGADLVLERAGDPEGRQLERVGDDDHPGLRGVDPPAGLERRLEHVAVGRQGDRDPRPAPGSTRSATLIRNGSGSIRDDEPLGRQVGEADADDVAVALVRDVEHGQPGDDRAGRSRAGSRPSAGRSRSGPSPPPSSSCPARRRPGRRSGRTAAGPSGRGPGRAASARRRRSSRARPATISAGTSSAFSRIARPRANLVFSTRNRPTAGRTSLQPPEAELVDLAGPLALAQADDQHLEDARLVASRGSRCAA